MKHTKPVGLIAALFVAFSFALAACSGCKTTLQEGGPYAGDTLLYRAELSAVSSYKVMDTFVKWEFDNRQLLAKYPAVRKAADHVRDSGPKIIAGLIAATELYRNVPTVDNKNSLVAALKIVQEEVAKAASYMNP